MRWRRPFVLLVGLAIPTLLGAQGQFFDAHGVKLHYIERGTGEPLVLLHGRSNNVDLWTSTGILDQLSARYRVVAFDARGHGKSEKPHDAKQYGRELALDVVRLMDHLRIDRAHVVGYSMGGQTVAQALTLHPDRFLTATQIAGSGIFEWTPQDGRDAEQEAVEIERNCVSRASILANVQVGDPRPSDDDMNARSAACFANATFDRFAMAALSRSRRDRFIEPARLAGLRVPTLGIVGSLDPLAETMRRLKKLRPDMKLLVVEGATHGSPTDDRGILRRPAAREALMDFLASHRQASGQRQTRAPDPAR
jgi:pimeloyl-ACP methyl ester carboxylesterase